MKDYEFIFGKYKYIVRQTMSFNIIEDHFYIDIDGVDNWSFDVKDHPYERKDFPKEFNVIISNEMLDGLNKTMEKFKKLMAFI
jgi:hypothetical protein